ncbi:MAG: 2,3,4,5-tetrahydropyridine-2,6-dicarboxylate N-succinyltransferase, partial [Woeseiaceae bacterium]
MQALMDTIEAGYAARPEALDREAKSKLLGAVGEALSLLDSGQARVAEKTDGAWKVNEWLKKAVLLHFRLQGNRLIPGAHSNFYDKVALKYREYSAEDFERDRVRVVPDAIVRYGAHVAQDVVLMPSYVNIGA